MIVCVSANPAIDKLFVVDRVTRGSIHRPLDFVRVPGGKGLNVTRAAAALGAEVRAAGLVGGHAGRWVAQALQEEGIGARWAWAHGETRSCLSVADRQTNELTEFYEDAADVTPVEWRRLQDVVEGLLPQADWLTISGSLPPGAPPDGYARLVEAARRAGADVALDARDESLEQTLPSGPDIVKINADEAGARLDARVETLEDALGAATELRRRGGRHTAAVVTCGPRGAVAVTSEGAWRGSADARGPYPVGSGDAFLAGLTVALERGGEWPRALALGLGAGAANAERPGAGRLSGRRATAIAGLARIVPAG